MGCTAEWTVQLNVLNTWMSCQPDSELQTLRSRVLDLEKQLRSKEDELEKLKRRREIQGAVHEIQSSAIPEQEILINKLRTLQSNLHLSLNPTATAFSNFAEFPMPHELIQKFSSLYSNECADCLDELEFCEISVKNILPKIFSSSFILTGSLVKFLLNAGYQSLRNLHTRPDSQDQEAPMSPNPPADALKEGTNVHDSNSDQNSRKRSVGVSSFLYSYLQSHFHELADVHLPGVYEKVQEYLSSLIQSESMEHNFESLTSTLDLIKHLCLIFLQMHLSYPLVFSVDIVSPGFRPWNPEMYMRSYGSDPASSIIVYCEWPGLRVNNKIVCPAHVYTSNA